jgi:hypothetical protein
LEQWLHDYCSFRPETMIPFIGYLSSLKIFKISTGVLAYHKIIGSLSHLPSLESLELCIVFPKHKIDELFDLLIDPLFLPRLQSLEFVCRSSAPWQSLPQIFASSHWRSLRVKVNIRPGYNIVDETAQLLRELVDEGFDLSIGEIDAALQECEEKWHLGE